jgi:hypothetical protein
VRDCGEAVGETLCEGVSDLLHFANMAQAGVGAKGENGRVVLACGGLEMMGCSSAPDPTRRLGRREMMA